MSELIIAPFEPMHAPEVIGVIGRVFAEYGMTFEPEGFDDDLQDIADHYEGAGGWFFVLLDAGRVVGTVAAIPREAGVCELKRLYLLPEYRGRGQGRALMERIMGVARAAGYMDLIAWSDERLQTAHIVYDRLGFERIGSRDLDDADQSHELGFRHRAPAGPGAAAAE